MRIIRIRKRQKVTHMTFSQMDFFTITLCRPTRIFLLHIINEYITVNPFIGVYIIMQFKNAHNILGFFSLQD